MSTQILCGTTKLLLILICCNLCFSELFSEKGINFPLRLATLAKKSLKTGTILSFSHPNLKTDDLPCHVRRAEPRPLWFPMIICFLAGVVSCDLVRKEVSLWRCVHCQMRKFNNVRGCLDNLKFQLTCNDSNQQKTFDRIQHKSIFSL